MIRLMPYWCRSLHKKSLSDGHIIRESKSPASSSNNGKSFACSSVLDRSSVESKMISESTPEIAVSETGLTYPRKPFEDLQKDGSFGNEKSDSFDFSNFVDLDWLSSSANSCDEDSLGRSILRQSSGNFTNEIVAETTPSTSESSIKGSKHTAVDDDLELEVPEEFSDSFLRWVSHGEAICH